MSRRAVALFVVVFASAAAVAYVSVPPPKSGDEPHDGRDDAEGEVDDFIPDAGLTDDDVFLATSGATYADGFAFDAEPAIEPNESIPRGQAQVQRRRPDDPDRSLVIHASGFGGNGPSSVLSGVRVRVEPLGGEPIVGVTDERGEFRVPSLSAFATVRVESADLAPVVVRSVGPGVLEVFPAARTRFVVRVVEFGTRTAIAGARVRGIGRRESLRASNPYFDVRTPASGEVTVTVPDIGPMRLIVVVPDGRRVESLVTTQMMAVVRIPSGGRIEGRVVDWNGQPVEGVPIHVRIVPPAGAPVVGGGHVGTVHSVIDGSFWFSGVHEGSVYTLKAVGERGAGSVEVSDVRLERSGVTRVHLELLEPGNVEIALVDETGAVIRGARISIDGRPHDFAIEPTGGQVAYRLQKLTQGRHRIHVESSLGPPQDFTIDVVAGVNALPVKVDAGVRVDGFVIDKKGLGVEGALVTIERDGASGGAADARTTRTRPGGEFAFGSLTVGAWRVSASAVGAATVEDVTVDAPRRGVRLTLATLGSARIQLTREAGGPVEGDFEIRRSRADGDVIHGSGTLKNGVVTIEGFDGRPETLEISVAGYSPVVKEVRVPPEGETDLGAVVMRTGHRIEGLLVGADGVGIQGAFVLVGHLGRVVSDRNGKWSFPGVPTGPISILVVSEFHLKKTLELESTTSAPLRIELSSGAHVAGTVVGSDGKGLGGLPIAFVPLDGEKPGEITERLRTDEDGTFEVRIPPGRYKIEAKEDGDAVAVLLADVLLTDGDRQAPTLVYRAK